MIHDSWNHKENQLRVPSKYRPIIVLIHKTYVTIHEHLLNILHNLLLPEFNGSVYLPKLRYGPL